LQVLNAAKKELFEPIKLFWGLQSLPVKGSLRNIG
jgi:hypothetical protein